jgi:hypothetical protein
MPGQAILHQQRQAQRDWAWTWRHQLLDQQLEQLQIQIHRKQPLQANSKLAEREPNSGKPKATNVQFFRYYRMIVLYAIQWIAMLFSAVSFLILVLSLLDLFFGLQWGYNWYSSLFAFAAITIGLLVRWIAATALKFMRST